MRFSDNLKDLRPNRYRSMNQKGNNKTYIQDRHSPVKLNSRLGDAAEWACVLYDSIYFRNEPDQSLCPVMSLLQGSWKNIVLPRTFMAHYVSDMGSGDFWTFWKQNVTAETPSVKK